MTSVTWPPAPEPGAGPRDTAFRGARPGGGSDARGRPSDPGPIPGVNPAGAGKTTAVEISVTLAADPRSAGVARRLLRDHLASVRASAAAVDAALDDDAAVVLSELVGNAVRHARGPLLVTLRSDTDGLRLEVRDGDPDRVPQPRDADREATSGRGMRLVHALSTRWGWTADDTGKTVWAELR